MMEMMQIWAKILEPVLIHFIAINIVQMMGLHADAAFLTTMAAVMVLPFFCYMMKKDGCFQKKRKTLAIRKTAEIVLLGIGANAVCSILLNLINSRAGFSNDAQEALFGSRFAVQLVGIGIVVPIMEEVLFRGLVYNRLKAYNNEWLSMILAAGIFAVYHGNPLQILFAFPMGLLLLAVYEKEGTLMAPVALHMAVNISSILFTAAGSL